MLTCLGPPSGRNVTGMILVDYFPPSESRLLLFTDFIKCFKTLHDAPFSPFCPLLNSPFLVFLVRKQRPQRILSWWRVPAQAGADRAVPGNSPPALEVDAWIWDPNFWSSPFPQPPYYFWGSCLFFSVTPRWPPKLLVERAEQWIFWSCGTQGLGRHYGALPFPYVSSLRENRNEELSVSITL